MDACVFIAFLGDCNLGKDTDGCGPEYNGELGPDVDPALGIGLMPPPEERLNVLRIFVILSLV